MIAPLTAEWRQTIARDRETSFKKKNGPVQGAIGLYLACEITCRGDDDGGGDGDAHRPVRSGSRTRRTPWRRGRRARKQTSSSKSLLGMDSFSARKMTNPPVHVKRIFMNGHSGRNAPSRLMIWIASVRGEQNCTRPGLPPHVLAREFVVTWRVWQRASLCPVIFLHGRPVAKSADRPPSAGRAAFPSAAASRCG
jgi:hypothetical protein